MIWAILGSFIIGMAAGAGILALGLLWYNQQG